VLGMRVVQTLCRRCEARPRRQHGRHIVPICRA
jgi:hypothetical protein